MWRITVRTAWSDSFGKVRTDAYSDTVSEVRAFASTMAMLLSCVEDFESVTSVTILPE